MYAASVFTRRLNLNSLKVFLKPCCNERLRLVNIRNKITFDFKQQVQNDVVLYELHKTHHFKYINIISLTQCAFWTNLGYFLYDNVKKSKTAGVEHQAFWKKVLENEKYSTILALLAIVFGCSIFALTSFYTLRSITKLILHKGGKSVTITTYSLPGFNAVKQVPLSQIGATIHRTRAKKFLPIKVKNQYFYYLMDTKGEFHHPQLFDFTAGVSRNM